MSDRMADLRITLGTALLLIAGCRPAPDMEMQKRQSSEATAAPVQNDPRIEVTRIGVFRDDIAYHDTRGVYLVRDKKTGTEFIGISGVGIAEIGSHSTGKTKATDER